MVHGQLIAEGKVQKLTYRQLRRLEKLDLQKAREARIFQLAEAAVRGGGEAAAGIGIGFGNALNGYLSGDAIAFGVKSAAGFVFLEWFVNSYPNLARDLHLEGLLLGQSQPGPVIGTDLNGNKILNDQQLLDDLQKRVQAGQLTQEQAHQEYFARKLGGRG